MTEVAFLEREAAKHDAKMVRRLLKVRRTGFVGPQWALEAMLIGGLVEFGPPSDYIRYNHYRLTDAGRALLAKLEGGR